MTDLIILTILTGIAIDFARRIYCYHKTGDDGYKHLHFYGVRYRGKHE